MCGSFRVDLSRPCEACGGIVERRLLVAILNVKFTSISYDNQLMFTKKDAFRVSHLCSKKLQ
jgi:hypothetical protein